MRVLSLNFRRAIFAEESGEVPIFLLTITHPKLTTPIRLSTDPTDRISTDPLVYGTNSRGNQFLYVGMDITLPDEQDMNPPSSKLVISNVNRDLIPLARSVSTPAVLRTEAVLASALDAVEFSIPALDMVSLQYDVGQLTFSLSMDALTTEPYPSGSFNPASFPGLFY